MSETRYTTTHYESQRTRENHCAATQSHPPKKNRRGGLHAARRSRNFLFFTGKMFAGFPRITLGYNGFRVMCAWELRYVSTLFAFMTGKVEDAQLLAGLA